MRDYQNGTVAGAISSSVPVSGKISSKIQVSGSVSGGTKSTRELRFIPRSEFPDTGRVDVLYVDTTHNQAYYWDDNASAYVELYDIIHDGVISLDATYSSAKIESELAAKQSQIDSITSILSNKPNAYSKTTAEWALEPTLISELNALYIYTDYKTVDGVVIPGVKIGDGLAYVIDLPFATDVGGVTEEEKAFWNNKVSAFMDPYDLENLILSTN